MPFPFPLLTQITYTGKAIFHFAKPLSIPVRSELATYVALMIEEEWLELSLIETNDFERLVGAYFFDPTYFNETLADDLSTANDDGKNATTARRLQKKTEQGSESNIGDSIFIKDF